MLNWKNHKDDKPNIKFEFSDDQLHKLYELCKWYESDYDLGKIIRSLVKKAYKNKEDW